MRKNSYPSIVLCHRVVSTNGGIGRYGPGWGIRVKDLERNRMLLVDEGSRLDKNARILRAQVYPHEFTWDTPRLEKAGKYEFERKCRLCGTEHATLSKCDNKHLLSLST